MVNQVIKELWWAAATIDHFTTIQTMQNGLFAVEGTEFPALVENLQFPQASGSSGVADFLNLFAGIASLIGDITGLPEIGIAADMMGGLNSSLPFFQNPQNTTFTQTYEQIQGQIASLQQASQASNPAQKHHVLSDY